MKAKPYAASAAVRAKKEALLRRGIEGKVIYDPALQQSHVKYAVVGEPLVSVIIPTKNQHEDLELCVASLLERTAYRNYEVLVVDNGSGDANAVEYLVRLVKRQRFSVIRSDIPFNFSALNNLAAREARGEYLLFLNNDTEVRSTEWMCAMLGLAQRNHVGAVGARLLYSDGKIQHAGVVMYAAGPGHAFNGEDSSIIENLRFQMDGNWLAVTGACMMVACSEFFEAGCFDEELAVAYNDVALCMELRRKGYYTVLAHDAILVHHESRSRGLDEKDQ